MAQAVNEVHMLRCGGPGFTSWDPGRALAHHLASHAVAASHIKWRKMGTDISPGPVFLSRKREGLADVSTGLIFLTHTHTHTKRSGLGDKLHCHPTYKGLQEAQCCWSRQN